MINQVRNTVLSIINKNNNGYMTPEEFNDFARQAQLEIYENYFFQLASWKAKQNARRSGESYADIVREMVEVLDTFSETKPLNHNSGNTFFSPSLSTTGDDWYTLNRLTAYETLLASGTNDVIVVNQLVDNLATFIDDGVSVGDIVINADPALTGTDTKFAYVTDVPANVSVVLTADIFTGLGTPYKILKAADARDVERVDQSKIIKLNASNLTSPTSHYPAYTLQDELVSAYPLTINSFGELFCQYARYPVDPKWTYNSIGADGDPVFNPTASDYQDFELPLSDSIDLVIKICQYAGISIREEEVVGFEQREEQLTLQTES